MGSKETAKRCASHPLWPWKMKIENQNQIEREKEREKCNETKRNEMRMEIKDQTIQMSEDHRFDEKWLIYIYRFQFGCRFHSSRLFPCSKYLLKPIIFIRCNHSLLNFFDI